MPANTTALACRRASMSFSLMTMSVLPPSVCSAGTTTNSTTCDLSGRVALRTYGLESMSSGLMRPVLLSSPERRASARKSMRAEPQMPTGFSSPITW